jgi:hypothetical protein
MSEADRNVLKGLVSRIMAKNKEKSAPLPAEKPPTSGKAARLSPASSALTK